MKKKSVISDENCGHSGQKGLKTGYATSPFFKKSYNPKMPEEMVIFVDKFHYKIAKSSSHCKVWTLQHTRKTVFSLSGPFI